MLLCLCSCSTQTMKTMNNVQKCAYVRYPQKIMFTLFDKNPSRCSICNNKFRIKYFKLLPYAKLTRTKSMELLEEVIRVCCRRCSKFRMVRRMNAAQNSRNNVKNSFSYNDIVYPVFSYSKTVELYGGYFVPFYEPSGGVYITKKKEFSLVKLVRSCTQLWPLLIGCMAMVAVAGFIGWILDCRKNEEEFPKSFLRGWWEGIWWSFISMTTVGYGDKSPKSIPARFFSILWIFSGIVVFGIISASLTQSS